MPIITRTITNSVFTISAYNPATDGIEHINVSFQFEDVDAKTGRVRILKKAFVENPLLIPVYVYDEYKDSALYGLEESAFISHAKQANARNPETRGCITKEVHAFVADCLVFDDATKSVEMRVIPLPGKLDVDKAKSRLNRAAKGYTVVNVKEVREIIGLYYMPVADFVKLASVIEK